MASIGLFPFVRHLRAESNQYILHYRHGKIVREGAGISYWFVPAWSAVAQIPREDCETTFLLNERSSDFQDVSVQCTLTYRFVDYTRAASRLNFSIHLHRGVWLDPPLQRLANFLSQRAKTPARDYLVTVPVIEAIRSGGEVIRQAIEAALVEDMEIAGMGIQIVSLQVIQVAPSAEVEKAIQTPTREGIQQKADEAVFERRALAVEKERAIKQNELDTEIQLAQQQEKLIRRQGANTLLEVQQTAEAEKQRVDSHLELLQMQAKSAAKEARVRADGEADAKRLTSAAQAEAEERRVAIYREAPGHVALGMALQKLAGGIENIQHLNVTPDMLGSMFQQFIKSDPGSDSTA